MKLSCFSEFIWIRSFFFFLYFYFIGNEKHFFVFRRSLVDTDFDLLFALSGIPCYWKIRKTWGYKPTHMLTRYVHFPGKPIWLFSKIFPNISLYFSIFLENTPDGFSIDSDEIPYTKSPHKKSLRWNLIQVIFIEWNFF